MKKLYNLMLTLLMFGLFLLMCNLKGGSYGDFEKIIVFADSTIYEEIRPFLEETFDQFIYTPHEERSFYLDLQPIELLNTYKMRRNLIFLGLLSGQDQTSQYIQKALTSELQQAIKDGKVFPIVKEDLFATDQIVYFLSAHELAILKESIKNYSTELFKKLDKFHFKSLENAMFLNGGQDALEKYVFEKFGWNMRFQYEYRVAQESEDRSFFWIRRFVPDRNLFVYRFRADSMSMNGEWLINLRDSLTTVYFEGDRIDRKNTYLLHTNFNNQFALKLVGVWKNHKYFLGGPFRTYAFHDNYSKFIYVIDISVTAPGKRKKPFLDQLEVMANSFQLVHQKVIN